MYFRGATEQLDKLTIFYVVPHLPSKPEDASHFQLISPGILETSRIIAHRDGIPEQTVMLWLGHRDSKMVRHYYHLHDDDAQRQMSKLKSVGGAGAA
jgi:hypothetical protein